MIRHLSQRRLTDADTFILLSFPAVRTLVVPYAQDTTRPAQASSLRQQGSRSAALLYLVCMPKWYTPCFAAVGKCQNLGPIVRYGYSVLKLGGKPAVTGNDGPVVRL